MANNTNEELDIITLEFDDETTIDCEIMGVFDCDGKEFMALIPDDGSDDVYIYGYEEDKDGNFELLDIKSDEVFKRAVEEFEKIMAENEQSEE